MTPALLCSPFLNSDLRHICFHFCQSDDYEKVSAKHSSRLFLWTQLRYYGLFQMGMEYRTAAALEKAGGPLDESRGWTSVIKEKARLTPPPSPASRSIDTPLA
jgi:hypothetical protein